MITLFLLILIYLGLFSLGLPDSLLGVTWPVIRLDMGYPLEGAALIAFFLTGSTFISSILSGHIIKKMGTGKVTAISCLMTALALLGFSIAPSYIWFVLLAIPLGFGGGSVDTALNNYVALHFKAHHMNWLHSFWGLGATTGPLIIAYYIGSDNGWRLGYKTVGLIQLSLAILFFLCLPLWKKHKALKEADNTEDTFALKNADVKKALSIKGITYALLTFTFYTTIEGSIGLWGSSFLIDTKGIIAETAATWVALYYGGIAAGRFISGFVSFKLSNVRMIQIGVNILFIGVVLMFLPLPGTIAAMPLILIGFGLSPIFPAMIHLTPRRFGSFHSSTIIGYQIATATIGLAVLVPLIGIVMTATSMSVFPFLILISIVIIYICTTKLNRMFKD